jgi:hypothetical protein
VAHYNQFAHKLSPLISADISALDKLLISQIRRIKTRLVNHIPLSNALKLLGVGKI